MEWKRMSTASRHNQWEREKEPNILFLNSLFRRSARLTFSPTPDSAWQWMQWHLEKGRKKKRRNGWGLSMLICKSVCLCACVPVHSQPFTKPVNPSLGGRVGTTWDWAVVACSMTDVVFTRQSSLYHPLHSARPVCYKFIVQTWDLSVCHATAP